MSKGDREKDKKPAAGSREEREMVFLTCGKHGVKFPKGSACPHCVAETQ